jgi:hypothetical protein
MTGIDIIAKTLRTFPPSNAKDLIVYSARIVLII